jgi:hypothetical protein
LWVHPSPTHLPDPSYISALYSCNLLTKIKSKINKQTSKKKSTKHRKHLMETVVCHSVSHSISVCLTLANVRCKKSLVGVVLSGFCDIINTGSSQGLLPVILLFPWVVEILQLWIWAWVIAEEIRAPPLPMCTTKASTPALLQLGYHSCSHALRASHPHPCLQSQLHCAAQSRCIAHSLEYYGLGEVGLALPSSRPWGQLTCAPSTRASSGKGFSSPECCSWWEVGPTLPTAEGTRGKWGRVSPLHHTISWQRGRASSSVLVVLGSAFLPAGGWEGLGGFGSEHHLYSWTYPQQISEGGSALLYWLTYTPPESAHSPECCSRWEMRPGCDSKGGGGAGIVLHSPWTSTWSPVAAQPGTSPCFLVAIWAMDANLCHCVVTDPELTMASGGRAGHSQRSAPSSPQFHFSS